MKNVYLKCVDSSDVITETEYIFTAEGFAECSDIIERNTENHIRNVLKLAFGEYQVIVNQFRNSVSVTISYGTFGLTNLLFVIEEG